MSLGVFVFCFIWATGAGLTVTDDGTGFVATAAEAEHSATLTCSVCLELVLPRDAALRAGLPVRAFFPDASFCQGGENFAETEQEVPAKDTIELFNRQIE